MSSELRKVSLHEKLEPFLVELPALVLIPLLLDVIFYTY